MVGHASISLRPAQRRDIRAPMRYLLAATIAATLAFAGTASADALAFSGSLAPGQSATPFQCGHSPFKTVGAYRPNFAPLNSTGQRGHLQTWRDSAGRTVTFNGVVFRNHTRRTIVVAGWC